MAKNSENKEKTRLLRLSKKLDKAIKERADKNQRSVNGQIVYELEQTQWLAARKPIFDSKNLEIGQKIQLLGKAKKYSDQYLYAMRNREPKKTFKIIEEDNKFFVERTAWKVLMVKY